MKVLCSKVKLKTSQIVKLLRTTAEITWEARGGYPAF